MRMIDRAGGELGKTIAHPLQAKVDRILYLNLGDRKNWKAGSVIHFSRFNQIRNKIYVRQRLEQLGFTLCPNSISYELTGIDGYSKPKRPAARTKSKLELASVALKQSDVRTRIIEELLLSGKPINSSEITTDCKKRLRVLVSNLKCRKGLGIESVRVKQSGVDFMIYALDEVYLELVGGKIRSRIKDVTAYLEKHGEISAAKTGLPAIKLNSHISALRAKGYEIETIGIGQRKEAVFKLISKP